MARLVQRSANPHQSCQKGFVSCGERIYFRTNFVIPDPPPKRCIHVPSPEANSIWALLGLRRPAPALRGPSWHADAAGLAPLISHKPRCPGPASPLWHLLGLTRTQDTKLDVPRSWGAGSCPPGCPSGRPPQGNHAATRRRGENFPGSGNKTTQNRSTLLPRACCRALLTRSTQRCASVARAAVGTH